jgi:hypothetical protein
VVWCGRQDQQVFCPLCGWALYWRDHGLRGMRSRSRGSGYFTLWLGWLSVTAANLARFGARGKCPHPTDNAPTTPCDRQEQAVQTMPTNKNQLDKPVFSPVSDRSTTPLQAFTSVRHDFTARTEFGSSGGLYSCVEDRWD